MSKVIIIDVETGGLYPNKNPMLQLSGIIEIDGEEKQRFDYFVQPFRDQVLEDAALKVNGFSREEIGSEDSIFQDPLLVYENFINVLSNYVNKFDKKDKFFFVGYNSHTFDMGFVREFFKKCGDTYGIGSWFFYPSIDMMLIMASHLMIERSSMTNFKLPTVCKACNIIVDPTRLHDSMYDVELTRDLFKLLKK